MNDLAKCPNETKLKIFADDLTILRPVCKKDDPIGLVSFHPTINSPHVISPQIRFTPRSFHPTLKLSNTSQINDYCHPISTLQNKELRKIFSVNQNLQ